MNFLAHAALALEVRDEPRFVLGAMLPDLASMSGGRVRAAADAEVAGGLALHRACDAAFHRSPGFQSLVVTASALLRARGLARGAALGAAHVGLELLLDGTLVADAQTVGAYLAGLRAAAREEVQSSIRWAPPESSRRFERLRARLERTGAPEHYRDPDRVAQAVARALGAHPRLALDADGERITAAWLREAREKIELEAARLLAEVRAVVREGAPT